MAQEAATGALPVEGGGSSQEAAPPLLVDDEPDQDDVVDDVDDVLPPPPPELLLGVSTLPEQAATVRRPRARRAPGLIMRMPAAWPAGTGGAA